MGLPPPPEDPPNAGGDGNAAARDPWTNIFPSLRAAPAHNAHLEDQAAFGMYDAEDGVYRCLDCLHEIWAGSCAQCGRLYPGHDEHDEDSDAGEGDIAGIYHALHNGLVNGFFPQQWYLSDDDDEDENEGSVLSGSEGSYDESFIDDEEDREPHRRPHHVPPHDADVIELTDDSPDEEEDEDTGLPQRRRRRAVQHQHHSVSENEDGIASTVHLSQEVSDDEGAPRPKTTRGGGRGRIVVSDDEDGDEGDEDEEREG